MKRTTSDSQEPAKRNKPDTTTTVHGNFPLAHEPLSSDVADDGTVIQIDALSKYALMVEQAHSMITTMTGITAQGSEPPPPLEEFLSFMVRFDTGPLLFQINQQRKYTAFHSAVSDALKVLESDSKTVQQLVDCIARVEETHVETCPLAVFGPMCAFDADTTKRAIVAKCTAARFKLEQVSMAVLPPEILVVIIGHLDYMGRSALYRTNHLFRGLVREIGGLCRGIEISSAITNEKGRRLQTDSDVENLRFLNTNPQYTFLAPIATLARNGKSRQFQLDRNLKPMGDKTILPCEIQGPHIRGVDSVNCRFLTIQDIHWFLRFVSGYISTARRYTLVLPLCLQKVTITAPYFDMRQWARTGYNLKCAFKFYPEVAPYSSRLSEIADMYCSMIRTNGCSFVVPNVSIYAAGCYQFKLKPVR